MFLLHCMFFFFMNIFYQAKKKWLDIFYSLTSKLSYDYTALQSSVPHKHNDCTWWYFLMVELLIVLFPPLCKESSIIQIYTLQYLIAIIKSKEWKEVAEVDICWIIYWVFCRLHICIHIYTYMYTYIYIYTHTMLQF